LEFKYQSLKNLTEKLLRGRKGITRDAVESLDKELVRHAEVVLNISVEEADYANRKRITGKHVERAIAILQRGR